MERPKINFKMIQTLIFPKETYKWVDAKLTLLHSPTVPLCTRQMFNAIKEFFSGFRESWWRQSEKGNKHAKEYLARKLVLSPYRGSISFPFSCRRHLRFLMTSTNFTLFFLFTLDCPSLCTLPPKSASWQFFFLTHPSVSSVFVLWCLPFHFPLCMIHVHFHFIFYNPFYNKSLLPSNCLWPIQSHTPLKRNKRHKKDAFIAAIPWQLESLFLTLAKQMKSWLSPIHNGNEVILGVPYSHSLLQTIWKTTWPWGVKKNSLCSPRV